jgi:hypothetical protein
MLRYLTEDAETVFFVLSTVTKSVDIQRAQPLLLLIFAAYRLSFITLAKTG